MQPCKKNGPQSMENVWLTLRHYHLESEKICPSPWKVGYLKACYADICAARTLQKQFVALLVRKTSEWELFLLTCFVRKPMTAHADLHIILLNKTLVQDSTKPWMRFNMDIFLTFPQPLCLPTALLTSCAVTDSLSGKNHLTRKQNGSLINVGCRPSLHLPECNVLPRQTWLLSVQR